MIVTLAAPALAADFAADPAPAGPSAQVSLGAAQWVGVFGRHGEIGPVLQAGPSLGLTVGLPVFPRTAVELGGSGSFHPAMHPAEIRAAVSGGELPVGAEMIEGDLAAWTALARLSRTHELSGRVAVSGRLGGGVLVVPQPVEQRAFVLLSGGPAAIWHTRLTGFDVGVAVDAQWAVAFDVGVSASGVVRYTGRGEPWIQRQSTAGAPVPSVSPEATLRARTAPAYPEEARLTYGGTDVSCRMTVAIDATGLPTAIGFDSCPEVFQESAREAVMQWRWKPAQVDGEAVETSVPLTVRYVLP